MKRVLVCEDEDLIRKGICKIVEGVCRDVQVQECDNGLEGYKAIAMWKPHVVITDIRTVSYTHLDVYKRQVL